MKNVFILLSFLCIFFYNCSSQTSSDSLLPGTWNVTNYDADLNGIPPQVLESAKIKTLTNVFIFNTDQTFTLKSVDLPTGNKGTWAYNPESKILELNYEVKGKKSKVIYTIEEMSASSAKWVQNMNQMGKVNLTLKKQ